MNLFYILVLEVEFMFLYFIASLESCLKIKFLLNSHYYLLLNFTWNSSQENKDVRMSFMHSFEWCYALLKPSMVIFFTEQANWKQHKAIRGGISACFARVSLKSNQWWKHIWFLLLNSMLFLFQFGDLGSLEQHGFARNRMWSLDRDPSPLPPPLDNHSSVDLILKSTKVDLKTPHRYIYMYGVNQTVFVLLNKMKYCWMEPAKMSNLYGCFCSFEFRLRISLSADKLILIPRVRNTDNKAFSFSFALRNYLSGSDIRCASYI